MQVIVGACIGYVRSVEDRKGREENFPKTQPRPVTTGWGDTIEERKKKWLRKCWGSIMAYVLRWR